MADNIINIAFAKGATLFQPARWKAYLKDLHDNEAEGIGHKSILQIFHSEKLWFTRDDANGHQAAAEEHLKQCDAALEESNAIITALEKERANKPKPSEMLDWSAAWW